MREALFRDSSNRLMFRRGIAAARNAGLAASSVRAAQSGRARSFCEAPQCLGRPFERLVAGPRFGYAATSVSGWRVAPPCCAGQSVSGFGGVAKLRATHQFLQESWSRAPIVSLIEHRTSPSTELPRTVTQWIWGPCQTPSNSPVSPKELVAYAGNRVPHRASP